MSNVTGDGLRNGAIYVRQGTESIEATYESVQKIINRRVDTGFSTSDEFELKEHLAQLKILYGEISQYTSGFGIDLSRLRTSMGLRMNQNYPNEDYESFIVRMIDRKKKRIEKDLGVNEMIP